MPHVLVADHEPAIAQLFAYVLTIAGYRVTATDLAGMTAALADDPTGFALVVVGVATAGPDAAALVTKVRELAPGLPIVLTTSPADPRPMPTDPQVRVLVKPFGPVQLTAAVRDLLAGSPDPGRMKAG